MLAGVLFANQDVMFGFTDFKNFKAFLVSKIWARRCQFIAISALTLLFLFQLVDVHAGPRNRAQHSFENYDHSNELDLTNHIADHAHQVDPDYDIIEHIIASGDPKRNHLLKEFMRMPSVTNEQIIRLIEFGMHPKYVGQDRFIPEVATAITSHVTRKKYSLIADQNFVLYLKKFMATLGPNSPNRTEMYNLFIRQKLFTPNDLRLLLAFIINVKDPHSLDRINQLFPFLSDSIPVASENERAELNSKLEGHSVKSLSALILQYKLGKRDAKFLRDLLYIMFTDFAESLNGKTSVHPSVLNGDFDQVLGELNWMSKFDLNQKNILQKIIAAFKKTAKRFEQTELNPLKLVLFKRFESGEFIGLMDSSPVPKSIVHSCENAFFGRTWH